MSVVAHMPYVSMQDVAPSMTGVQFHADQQAHGTVLVCERRRCDSCLATSEVMTSLACTSLACAC